MPRALDPPLVKYLSIVGTNAEGGFRFLIYSTPIRQQLFSALNLMSVEFWTGIQSEYEVAMAKNRIEDRLDREIRPYKAA
jgi:hypothetical protein